ncbi:MAG TPA: ATP-binding protein [Streptosporangiaceae bacterium]
MSIRLRVALVFTFALAVAFALGSWLFLTQLHNQLVTNTLKAQLAPYLPAATGRAGPISALDNVLVQVISRSGRIIGHSSEAGRVRLLNPSQLRQARAGLFSGTGTNDGDRVQIAAEPVGRGGRVLVVATSGEDAVVASTVRTSTTALIIGGIVFVLAGGAGAYWLAAAALSPVERMRRQVAALSVGDAAGGVQVPRTRDELAALAGTMNDLLARLHEALARQRGFVADASHELRTPLAVLGAELELAGRPGRSRDELASAVANAEDEVARLTRLTNDLLLLARSDEGRLPVRPAPADVGALLARSAERASGRAAEAGVTCVVQTPDGLIAALDEDRIRQAVDNLVDNALRFAPAGSAVRVAARRSGQGGRDLVIEVADAGPGFPAGFLPHAFERFKRPDTSRTRSDGGAGLGLAIVAAIAAAHGGVATARNAGGGGGGATVSIELPGALDVAGAVTAAKE